MSEFLSHRTAYRVWCPERGSTKEDGMRVDAFSPESAAVKWAERDDADSADYLIVRGNDATVLVAEDHDGAQEHRFTVSGESCPVYRARQIT
ncbi:hypothetical protein [Luteibacter sp.]|uniref:hypothetical protein n=1 Tax=Luteibacter sp. TaxID=1886636 RepID=UPI0025BB2FC2|nr:hypothetical protein [Luteibacter sp.]